MNLKTAKAKAVKQYVKALVYQKDTTSSIKKIQNIFKNDTINQKLYKYCGVSEFTYINLLHNTLYCSPPQKFNDPFDVNPGWALPQVMQINSDDSQAMLSVFEVAVKVVTNQMNLNDVSTHEYEAVQALVQNTKFSNLISQYQSGETLFPEDVITWIQALTEAMPNHPFSQQYQQNHDILNQQLMQIFTKLINQNTASNITSMSQLAKALNPAWDVDNVEALCLLTKELFVPDKQIQQLEQYINSMDKLIQKLREAELIGCLTTTYTNRLMWSHYGQHHQGICIEYDFSSFDFVSPIIPLPICYTTQRPCLPGELTQLQDTREMSALILHGLLQKDADWQYENEWRIFMNPESGGNFPMPPISCIYLGACISDVHKEIICNLAQQQGIPVKQMKMDREIYELHAHPV